MSNQNNNNCSSSEKEEIKEELKEMQKMFDDYYTERMDRIDMKLNQLTDAVVSIARAEEKIAVLIEDTREIKLAINAHTSRIHQLEVDTVQNTSGLKNLGKFFWITTSAVATAITAIFLDLFLGQ